MFVLLLTVFICGNIVSADVSVMSVTAIIGYPVILQCDNDTDQTLMSVIWKIHLRNNYTCILARMVSNESEPHSTCSARHKYYNLSLTIDSAQISDKGNYTCEIATAHGTCINVTTLYILAEPSVTLGLDRDGSPECRAIGGYPAADVSWVPHSQDINTTSTEDPDGTWTVISVYSVMGGNVSSVTCVISHPTFMDPQKKYLSVSGGYNGETNTLWALSLIPILFSITGCIVCWKRSQLRKCFKKSLNTTPPQLPDGTEEVKDGESLTLAKLGSRLSGLHQPVSRLNTGHNI